MMMDFGQLLSTRVFQVCTKRGNLENDKYIRVIETKHDAGKSKFGGGFH